MDAGTFDAEQDAQVDGGPAGVGLAAVAALLVSRETLDALQDGLPSDAAFPRLTGRIDAAGGRRGCSVQMLHVTHTEAAIRVTEQHMYRRLAVGGYLITAQSAESGFTSM